MIVTRFGQTAGAPVGSVNSLASVQSPKNIACPEASADTFRPPPYRHQCEARPTAYPAGDGSAATFPSMPPNSRRVR